MKELSPSSSSPWAPALPDLKIKYFANFISKKDSERYFNNFINYIPWEQDSIRVYGKIYNQPRLTSLHGINQKSYSYSGITMYPKKMTSELIEIKNKIKNVCNTNFTSVLLNLYRDGKDSNGWHADDEEELGTNPVIASVSFGEERFFQLKHKTKKIETMKFKLASGSLLLMEESTQHNWYHKIAKTSKKISPRINLTYRKIYI